MELREIIDRFESPKRLKDNSYQVKCPCHKDKQASLTITQDRDKILMHCHAGCRTEDIVRSAGLTMAQLNVNEREKSSSPFDKLGNTEAVYNYGDYYKVRLEGKRMLFGTVVNGEFVKGIGNIPRTLYNLSAVLEAVKNGYPVYIVEGEKDADTLKRLGYPACTPGGCGDWKSEFAKYFTGARVVILPDNDKPGIDLANRIAKDYGCFT